MSKRLNYIDFWIGIAVIIVTSIKNFLKKNPKLFYIASRLFFIFIKINRSFSNKYNRLLCKIFDDFCNFAKATRDTNIGIVDEKNFNTNHYDDKIEEVIFKYYENNKKKFLKQKKYDNQKKRIAILFTEIYQVGGKTPLVDSFFKSFHEDYDLNIFATFTIKRGAKKSL